VNKDIGAAITWLNEAEPLCLIEEFYCSLHLIYFKKTKLRINYLISAKKKILTGKYRRIVFPNQLSKGFTSRGSTVYDWLIGDTKTNEVAKLELGLKDYKIWCSKGIMPGFTAKK
jgi:hypothetical protein